MDEYEMVGRQVKSATHLLAASSQLNVFDLLQMSALLREVWRRSYTFAILVRSMAIFDKQE